MNQTTLHLFIIQISYQETGHPHSDQNKIPYVFPTSQSFPCLFRGIKIKFVSLLSQRYILLVISSNLQSQKKNLISVHSLTTPKFLQDIRSCKHLTTTVVRLLTFETFPRIGVNFLYKNKFLIFKTNSWWFPCL